MQTNAEERDAMSRKAKNEMLRDENRIKQEDKLR